MPSQLWQLVDRCVEFEVWREEFCCAGVDETVWLSDGDICNAGDIPDFCENIRFNTDTLHNGRRLISESEFHSYSSCVFRRSPGPNVLHLACPGWKNHSVWIFKTNRLQWCSRNESTCHWTLFIYSLHLRSVESLRFLFLCTVSLTLNSQSESMLYSNTINN